MSPRGTLAPFLLQRSKKKKAISLALGQRYALEHASFIHVTSEAEAAEVRAYGLRNEIVLAPNGFECGAALDVARVPGRIVFLSRLHPKKGIDRLLDAWKLLSARVPHAELIIAGPSEGGHGEEMQARARDLGLARVSFPGEKLGMEKRRLLASASAFVLPSHNENFGMVVVEALAEGTPVVASFGTPWATLDEAGVGRWVPNDPEPMAAAMVAMLELRGEARAEVERRARAFARDRFDAARAAEPLIEAYARVLADRSRRTRDRASREGSVAGH
jgi:glycosyltransferase involved in cell wall biosynthesis